jgi:hypothetical protein
MAIDPNDWRLRGQERYLQARSWSRRKYVAPHADRDHDHCAFCWIKFMETPAADVLDEGYVTEDGAHWVCPTCFEDFRERFGWSAP